jgi:hypothetical protein
VSLGSLKGQKEGPKYIKKHSRHEADGWIYKYIYTYIYIVNNENRECYGCF